jgi:hypothetical protein
MRLSAIQFMTSAWNGDGSARARLPNRLLVDFSIGDGELTICRHMELDMKNAEAANVTRIGLCFGNETLYRAFSADGLMEDADFADWCERVGQPIRPPSRGAFPKGQRKGYDKMAVSAIRDSYATLTSCGSTVFWSHALRKPLQRRTSLDRHYG